MDALAKAFTEHPRSVGETYFGHLAMALGFAGLLAAATAACLVHALLPFCFQTTASRLIGRLHEAMMTHRTQARETLRAA